MESNLVIVESPAKAKTIEKFLGKTFNVKSSNGHIRDLSKKDFGIDIKNNFAPNYEISADKKKMVAELKKIAKNSTTVWLASDEDREGEAIAWHLFEALGLKKENTKRIVFHEITKEAIQNAVKNPRDIDDDLVSAQQARRILDRLVGFELSPLLWRKVKPSLSAGRVQSVAVRLIVEREREIINFTYESYYKVTAKFEITDEKGKKVDLDAELQTRFKTKEEVNDFLNNCKKANYKIDEIEKKPSKKSPTAPFTTSTLQQEASRKLGFSVSQTMRVAQSLYESGKITYMRTDSVNLSDSAMNAIKEQIISEFGEKYYKHRLYKTKTKGAQEAHEAIRPAYMENNSVSGTYQEQRLYELIWKRTLASQMSDANIEKTNIIINCSICPQKFIASGEQIKFDGFLRVYTESTDDENGEKTKSTLLPIISKNTPLNLKLINAIERFSKNPPRFTEASLVKKLEELGIGRPSTYAPTISTIQKRGYVIKEDREGKERNFNQFILKNNIISHQLSTEVFAKEKSKLFPTNIGMVVNDFLIKYFENILDFNFTADVEKQFDQIAIGKLKWTNMIDKFYHPFHEKVEKTLLESEHNSGERILGNDPETNKLVLARIGRFGPIVQLGDAEKGDKLVFASLTQDQLIETINLEQALKLLKENKDGRKLGIHPENGRPIFARVGRFGPMVQIGESDDEEKPSFASLLATQNINTITFGEALELFKFPRTIGDYESKTVVIGIGRFGPYIKHKSKFTSLKKEDDPLTINLERAIELIEAKRESDNKKLIKEFPENKDIIVVKDRWGNPTIKFKTKYYRLPKDIVPENLTLEKCIELLPAEKNSKKTVKKTVKTKAKTNTKIKKPTKK
ncbi:MAG: type I DNA topoisomerase [Bacteroidales bacterium]|nr:type I DNA topoisomerase [Bacteroidales bacterium]MBN2755892.1 type I DNA topoisomerase [Bacteroidales bacterium]